MGECVDVKRAGPIATVVMHRKGNNGIAADLMKELSGAFEALGADESVRVVILASEYEKYFCVGADLTSMGGIDRDAADAEDRIAEMTLGLQQGFNAIEACPKPVIARVNGHALGTGLGLVAACTFSVALMDAQFGTPEIHAGLFPMMVMGLLARVMPRQRLLEMMLLGEKIDAAEAARIGLVGHAVEPGELDETIRSIVSQLIAKSPLAVRLGLRAFAAQEDVELARALPMLRKQFAESLNTDDAREGLMAFLEKRSPHWTGK